MLYRSNPTSSSGHQNLSHLDHLVTSNLTQNSKISEINPGLDIENKQLKAKITLLENVVTKLQFKHKNDLERVMERNENVVK